MNLTSKQKVDELRKVWKQLWQEQVGDEEKTECIGIEDYSELFVDSGTVMHAARDVETLTFNEILDHHQIMNAKMYMPLNPQVGGLTKFIKTFITNQKSQNNHISLYYANDEEKNHRRKGGRS